jgi:hypothetical protein
VTWRAERWESPRVSNVREDKRERDERSQGPRVS